ncbi:MAG TPA: hypothetical protein VGS41_11235, partial [Chthonomonadales bacterium]|nr:hypothetical protein [Chthonomonadales bacterium]
MSFPALAQNALQSHADPFQPIFFLIGTWEARTINNPSVTAVGAYTFQSELNGHVVARHSISDTAKCKGPADFNCEHGDMLYIYADAPGQPLHAIYFDNEGHVIHYAVSAPTPASAEFLSDPQQPGPQFRLFYELKGTVMSGRFQMRMPGHPDWHSYLEWTGAKK